MITNVNPGSWKFGSMFFLAFEKTLMIAVKFIDFTGELKEDANY
jgi:hypothetical protein